METTGVYTPLPDGLDGPPGPELTGRLWSLEPARYNGFQLVDLVRAQYRQVCADQARLLWLVRDLAHSTPGGPLVPPGRTADIDSHADTELAGALALSTPAASEWIVLASFAIDRVPALHAAMLAGDLDLPRLRMLARELMAVDPETARRVVEKIRPQLARSTLGQLRYRVARLLLTLDPDAAAARAAQAEAERAVYRDPGPGNTVTLSVTNLPAARAAAAWENITAIARATHAAGDPLGRTLDQLRADVCADLLAGVDPTQAGAATPGPRAGTIHLHIDLTTLARLDENPGEIEGFGPVLAEVARQTAAQLGDRAQWRFATTDEHGELVAEGALGGRRRARRDRGRARYRPEASITRRVVTRDRTCRAPGCGRPARICDIDHVQPWSQGGQTTVDNLVSLCRRHHRAKHAGGHALRFVAGGIAWSTPRGRRYLVRRDTVVDVSTRSRR